MEIISHAECIELKTPAGVAVIVAEGLRSWCDVSGRTLISRGPRFKAASEKLGRLRPVPDRLGVVDSCAQTHAVILAKNCRTEEMELTQNWNFSDDHTLEVELEFIVPPACAGLDKLGVELDFPGDDALFELHCENAEVCKLSGFDGTVIAVNLKHSPVPAGIHRVNLTFAAKNS